MPSRSSRSAIDQYFRENQRMLVELANTRFGRDFFMIRRKEPVVRVTPNSITHFLGMRDGKVELHSTFRTHQKYAKLIRHRWPSFDAYTRFFAGSDALPISRGALNAMAIHDASFSGFSSSGDGSINSVSNISWANARSGGNLTFAANGTTTNDLLRNDHFPAGPFWYIYRAYLPFDTSSIGAGATVSAASLTVTSTGAETAGETIYDTHLVKTNQASITALTTSDWVPDSFTSGGEITVASWSIGDGNDNTMTLNATGRSWINGSGSTLLGLIGEADQTDTAPTVYNAGRAPYLYFSERTGTTDDPVLDVTYTVATSKNLLLLGVGT